jgi:hypothetical protein
MIEAVARDILSQYFKVLKKDPTIKKSQAVEEAELLLGEEIVQEIKNSIDNK